MIVPRAPDHPSAGPRSRAARWPPPSRPRAPGTRRPPVRRSGRPRTSPGPPPAPRPRSSSASRPRRAGGLVWGAGATTPGRVPIGGPRDRG